MVAIGTNRHLPFAAEGAVIQPFPAEDAWATQTLTNGVFFGTVFVATQGGTIGNFVMLQAGSMGGATTNRCGLYTVAADQSMTLVARTGQLSGSSAGWSVLPFNTTGGYAATVTIVAENVYCVGICQVAATTPPTIRAKSYVTVPLSSPALTLTKRSVNVPAANDCPASIAANAALDAAICWIGLA
jgi:hypothetical protein